MTRPSLPSLILAYCLLALLTLVSVVSLGFALRCSAANYRAASLAANSRPQYP